MLNSRTHQIRRATVAALAAGALFAVAGCGEEVLDTGDVESQIAEEYKSQRDVEVDVKCPDDMKPKKGETHRCDVSEPGGSESKVTITMTDDEGAFEFRVPSE